MKHFNFLIIAGALIFSSGCKDKTPIACIKGPSTISRNQTVDFEWCGQGQDELEWTTSYGEKSNNYFFRPKFPAFGKYTITATGTYKKKSASKTVEVEYGIMNEFTCELRNSCYTGNTNILNPNGFKAYLYLDLAAWSNDVENRVHTSAIDSVDFSFSADKGTIMASFTNTLLPGTTAFVSVENKQQNNLTNWAELSELIWKSNEKGANARIDLTELGKEFCNSTVTEKTAKLFSGKWTLYEHTLNGNMVAVANCNKDDYIVFSPNGNWKYEIGSDNCNGTSQTSSGTVGSLPKCLNGDYFTLTTVSGPFTGITYAMFTDSDITIYYSNGSLSGNFKFKYMAKNS